MTGSCHAGVCYRKPVDVLIVLVPADQEEEAILAAEIDELIAAGVLEPIGVEEERPS